MKTRKNVHLDVPILSYLDDIVQKNMTAYQSDFYEVDTEQLVACAKEVVSDTATNTFVWICREHGTHMKKFNECFMRDTSAYATVDYFRTCSSGEVKATVIINVRKCVSDKDGNIIPMGDVFDISFDALADACSRYAVATKGRNMRFKKSYTADYYEEQVLFCRITENQGVFADNQAREGWVFVDGEYVPESEDELGDVLCAVSHNHFEPLQKF